MSKANITAIIPVPAPDVEIVLVVFQLRDGSTRTYSFTGPDAHAVLSGADPSNLHGTLVLGAIQ